MRIAICWHSLSGYMAACWRALAARPGVELLVVTQQPDPSGVAPFDASLVEGFNAKLVSPQAMNDPDGVRAEVEAFAPDVIVLNGWFVPAFNGLLQSPTLSRTRFAMAMDRPREGLVKDHVTRLRKRAFLRRMQMVFVAGERCRQFAIFLGFEERLIRRGTYAIDFDRLAPLYAQRTGRSGGWPRAFVYTGRYAPEKGLDTLVAAYALYRSRVSDPWPLNTCGKGELAGLLKGAAGISDLGFIQPADQPRVLAEQGVSVIVSTFEPWAAVVAEAAAGGLPLICSAAVGASVELVQPYHNGLIVAPGDVRGLARAMQWMHEHHAELPQMGGRSQELAAGASARNWAARWHEGCADLLAE